MNTENVIVSKMQTYLEEKGWKIEHEVKLRGRVADIVAIKGDEIALIEVKGSSGDIQRGIEQALHQKNAANFSYLAIPKERANDKILNTCKSLGIGLMLINDGVKEVVKPVRSEALPSVQKIILGIKLKKQEKKMRVHSSLENLFRSKAQILILKLLFMNSTSEFHMNDIARKTGLAPSTVAKEMPLVLKIGLVIRRTQGNLVFYKINNKSIIFDELKRIFLKYELLDEIIAKNLPAEKIKYAVIYCSFAKGTEATTSDVDLLVVGDIDEDIILKSISVIERRIGREINFILWKEKDLLDKIKEKIPLIREITKTPIIMIVGDEDEFKRLIK